MATQLLGCTGARPPALATRGCAPTFIRNDADLARIREYIRNNPDVWETDAEYHHQH
jgi:hypothetical protein